MSSEPNFGASAMEGKGAYNRHARLQAEGIALALPCIERVVETLEFGTADRPIIIADYGSSQGKNSLPPMSLAVRALRRRLGQGRPILVCHIDRP
jgi:hypothetical protein